MFVYFIFLPFHDFVCSSGTYGHTDSIEASLVVAPFDTLTSDQPPPGRHWALMGTSLPCESPHEGRGRKASGLKK